MAANANEILDRLAALLDASTPGPWMGDWNITTEDGDPVARTDVSLASDPAVADNDGLLIVAIRNAAPALIRLARAAIAMYGSAESGDATEAEVAVIGKQIEDGIKALGEVRL